MFWGLIMEPQRRYTQKVKKAFHISMASLDIATSSNEPAQVMCGIDGRNYLLCTLRKPDVMQCPLDLNFAVGSELSFAANGSCHVHLTGYLIEDFPELSEEDIEEEESEEEAKPKVKKRMKKENEKNGPVSKKSKMNSIEDNGEMSDDSDINVEDLLHKTFDEDDTNDDTYVEEEENDEDEEAESEDNEEGIEEEEDEEGEEEDEDSSSENESEEEQVNPNKNKKKFKVNGDVSTMQSTPKQNKNKQGENSKSPNKENKTPKKEIQSSSKEAKSPSSETKTPNKDLKKKVLQGGVIIEDIKKGQGPIAKPGKFVTVYYEGRLKQNNKMFDSTTKGNGFSFRLGAGEVIKGWDVGVNGMSLGGKRKIICPPAMAYGAKGSPPTIPGNSTLVFEVELKKMR